MIKWKSFGSAAWSPDGTRLVFESMRDGNREICMMLADDSNQTRLINNATDDTAPAWLPRPQAHVPSQ